MLSSRRQFDFKAGAAASDVGATAVVYGQFSLCSLGCGWLGHAALRLGLERWYVGTAVSKDGVGGLPGVVEQCGCRGGGPEGSLW
jgi:hypothetical protein